jgi:hypothetical protein
VAQTQRPSPGKILPLPRTRRLSLTAMALEAGHQIVLALWIGALVAISSLAVPCLLDAVSDPVLASRAALDLLSKISFLGCGAGSFLLLTTLLMHLLNLRSTRCALAQAGLILAMALVATAVQVYLAPEMSRCLRTHPDLFQQAGQDAEHFRFLFGVHLALLLLQALFGITLLLMGVRRWYAYVTERPERPELFWP